MTTKLKFITSACSTYNCAPSVVLNAVAGRASVHPELCKQIKGAADKSCNATSEEWRKFVDLIEDSPIAKKIIDAIVYGEEIKIEGQ